MLKPLVMVKGHKDRKGLSTYDLAFSIDSTIGTAQQWLASLTGPDGLPGASGLSAYDLAYSLDSTIGTAQQWLTSWYT